MGFGSFLGTDPCRVWLQDLDGDGALELYVGGGGSDLACYDLKTMRCRWAFGGAPVHPRVAAMLDLDGDGTPELVDGGDGGFLYVIGSDGGFRFSRSVGAGVTGLLALPGRRLAVGLETGAVLLCDSDLTPTHSITLGDAPVSQLALVGTAEAPVLVASDSDGRAARIALGE